MLEFLLNWFDDHKSRRGSFSCLVFCSNLHHVYSDEYPDDPDGTKSWTTREARKLKEIHWSFICRSYKTRNFVSS